MQESKKVVGVYHIYTKRKLGEGANGIVYIGKNTETNEDVAVKMIDRNVKSKLCFLYNIDNHSLSESYLINSLKRQATILSKINSEYVVGFRDIIATKRYYYIVQEKCDGSLKDYLNTRKDNPLTEKEATEFMVQMLNGYYPLLVMNVIHRDIKPHNFLMKKGKIKLADFGLSRKICGDKMLCTYAGSLGYFSPQISHRSKYTSKCDIYSLGLVFYELLYGKNVLAVDHTKTQSRMKEIDNIEFPIVPEVSELCKDVVSRCLRYQEKDRIDWIDLYNHELFVDKVPSLKKLHMTLNYILSTIRKEIEDRNINISKFLERMGIRKDKQIEMQDYTKLLLELTTIEKKNITLEEIKYSFNYFDRDESGKISYAEFVSALDRHGIEMNANNKINHKFQLIQKVISQQHQQSGDKFEEENMTKDEIELGNKTKAAYAKMIKEIIAKNVPNLTQKFHLQDLNSDGLNVEDFIELMQKGIGLNLTTQECKLSFNRFDQNNDNKVDFAEFEKFICKELEIQYSKSVLVEENKENS